MTHKVPLFVLTAALLTAGAAYATPPATSSVTATTAPAAASAAAPAQHFIWHVSKPHADIYLVGSIHTLNPDDYPLPEAMENHFVHATALVEEVNLTMMDPATVQQEALRLGLYPQGQSLQKELPPALYQQVSAQAQALGLDMDRLNGLRPWLVSITLTAAQLARAAFKPSDGVDHHFADEAQMMDKRVIGLETPRHQLELVAGLPAKAQQAMLQASLEQAASFNADVHALIGAWQKGDAAGLNQIMQKDFAENQVAYQKLIVDRNRAWFPRLERLARGGGSYFVVVGAAHLVGPDGLLTMFKKAGYKIEQL